MLPLLLHSKHLSPLNANICTVSGNIPNTGLLCGSQSSPGPSDEAALRAGGGHCWKGMGSLVCVTEVRGGSPRMDWVLVRLATFVFEG